MQLLKAMFVVDYCTLKRIHEAYRQQPNLANVLAAREGARAPICSDVVFLDLLEDEGQRVARLSPATFRRSSVKPGDWWQ